MNLDPTWTRDDGNKDVWSKVDIGSGLSNAWLREPSHLDQVAGKRGLWEMSPSSSMRLAGLAQAQHSTASHQEYKAENGQIEAEARHVRGA